MDELLIGSMIRTLLVGGEHAVVIVMLEGVDFNPSGILVVCMMAATISIYIMIIVINSICTCQSFQTSLLQYV
jgi:hypothetical protein